MKLAIIPARSGSTRIPHKNVRPFFGKPIIAYSIQTARDSHLFDAIVVSTDSQEYAAVAKGYGAKVHMRNHRLAENDVGTQEVTRAVLKWWAETHEGDLPEYACCIYATAPLMSSVDLHRGFRALEAGAPYDYAYSVGGNDFPFTDAGQFYWGRTSAFVAGRPLGDCKVNGDGSTILVHVRASLVCDINTEADWQRAERMYQELQEQAIEQREPAQ